VSAIQITFNNQFEKLAASFNVFVTKKIYY